MVALSRCTLPHLYHIPLHKGMQGGMLISRHAEKRTEKRDPITALLEQRGEMLPKAPHLPSVALTQARHVSVGNRHGWISAKSPTLSE